MTRWHGKFLAACLAVIMLVPFLNTVSFAAKEDTVDYETRKTPIMGWSSWNAYFTNISEEVILSQAEKLREYGLDKLGYVFVNIDDGWQSGRGEDGYVATNSERFPSGMKLLADTLHAMGFKAGIYSDAGALTCGYVSAGETANDNVGLYGYDEQDLRRYLIDWGYDFIKVDWCGGERAGLSKKERYTAIGNVIRTIEEEIGEDKIYNVCCWSFPGEWVVDVADSWRTGGDITNTFDSILYQIDNIKELAKYTGPGHVNDLDMMQVGNGMTYEEDKSHFTMWCMMSTPLMLGMDLNAISEETLSIISNAELIAIDQDVACLQATVAATYGNVEAWTKDLGSANSGKKAITLLNRGAEEVTLTVSFEELGLTGIDSLRNLWSHEDLSPTDSITVTIPAHGCVALTAEGTPIYHENDEPLVDDGSVVNATYEIAAKPTNINLTEIGKSDWVHYSDTPVMMKNGLGEISITLNGKQEEYDTAASTYRWTNAKGSVASGTTKKGIGVFGLGASISISTPCDRNVRTLCVTVGSYSADITVGFIVGGKLIKSETIKGTNAKKVDKLITLTYSSDIPTTAELRWMVSRDLGNSESVNVEGVAMTLDVQHDSLGILTMKDEEIVIPVTAATEGAILHTALRDTNGKLISLKSEKLTEIGTKFNHVLTNELPRGFVGTLECYLWDSGNQPLCRNMAIAVEETSYSRYTVGAMTADRLIKAGAYLVDVRTASEFAEGHIEGAMQIEYTSIVKGIEALGCGKDQPIVLYCSAAKRSAQALQALRAAGYTAVYTLGSMANYYVEPMITFSADTCAVVTVGDTVKVNFTASSYDTPEVYISIGKNSTFEDAVLIKDFRITEQDCYYLTLKAYLVQDGVCYAEAEKEFIYWSEDTVDSFATELTWSEATTGWGTIRKDKSIEGNPLTLAGKTFTHGIGTHATSRITMQIPEGASKFLAVAGGDLEKSAKNRMMFFVYIDGVLVAESSLIAIGQHFVFDIDIPEGAKEICLYVYEGPADGNTNDHADWAIAGFFNEAIAN